jgi:hypothetical protein
VGLFGLFALPFHQLPFASLKNFVVIQISTEIVSASKTWKPEILVSFDSSTPSSRKWSVNIYDISLLSISFRLEVIQHFRSDINLPFELKKFGDSRPLGHAHTNDTPKEHVLASNCVV